MDNVQALKNLYAALGGDPADVADISTNAGMINAIAGLEIGGGGGTVDQTYDATSENAQSGVAVASALTFKEASGFLVPTMTSTASQNFPDVTGNFRSGQLFAIIGEGGSTTSNQFVFMIPRVLGVTTKIYPVFDKGNYCCDIGFEIYSNSAQIRISNYSTSSNFIFSSLKLYVIG